ncbi:bactofilin family protein [Serratia marcescens]|uniref:bactofilin family protein n=1 Tax=Serratia marcescens TaxID=615 RepID=UPI000DFFD48A|nr:polymer-forming cytoskeletal protein [Serratia marcescens]SUJ35674.1 Polymer-forming cytoskeletal [Serratia marcescens]
MRTNTALWTMWFTWGLWILSEIYPGASVIKWAALLVTGGMLILFFRPLLLKRTLCMRLLKRGNNIVNVSAQTKASVDKVTNTPADLTTLPLLPPDAQEGIKPIRARKDTFISPEANLSGNLEGQGNIVIEGRLDGNVSSSHQVRVESGGLVVGDIHAQHIVVNGKVEGRFYADAITLQSEGHIRGDIFTDALIIEKGGVFIGQSQLKLQEQVTECKGNVAKLKVPDIQDISLLSQ